MPKQRHEKRFNNGSERCCVICSLRYGCCFSWLVTSIKMGAFAFHIDAMFRRRNFTHFFAAFCVCLPLPDGSEFSCCFVGTKFMVCDDNCEIGEVLELGPVDSPVDGMIHHRLLIAGVCGSFATDVFKAGRIISMNRRGNHNSVQSIVRFKLDPERDQWCARAIDSTFHRKRSGKDYTRYVARWFRDRCACTTAVKYAAHAAQIHPIKAKIVAAYWSIGWCYNLKHMISGNL